MIFHFHYSLWCEPGGSDVTGSIDRVGDGQRHVLDGLLYRQSDVAARRYHTDGGGDAELSVVRDIETMVCRN